MKNLIIFTFLLFLLVPESKAQNYTSAIGLRLGYPVSVSYKHFINEKHALEGNVGFRARNFYRSFNISGAYQFHNPINIDNFPENFQWYWGVGGSIYLWSWDNGFGEGAANTSFGAQGYIGLEYKFENIPLNISLDWVPTFFLNGYSSGFGVGFGAVAVRYVLNN